MEPTVAETTPMLKAVAPPSEEGDNQSFVYKRRWYIVFIFATWGCLQGALCVVWTVVAESSEAAFGWTNGDISFMQQWIYTTYVVAMGPMAWLMQNKGMRVATLLAGSLTFLGTVSRVITSSPPYVTWLAHVGNILNGLGGVVLFTGSAVLSATWFPPNQRATATAISSVFGLSGNAVIYVIDPYVVPSPIYNQSTSPHKVTNVEEMRNRLMILRYAECGIASVLMIMTLIYFPARPPRAPSVSAGMEKLDFFTGLKQLFSRQKANFWFAAIASGISAGLFGVFTSLLDVNLKSIHVKQTTAGWLGFYTYVAGCLGGLLVGRMGDKLIGQRKLILLLMAVFAALAAFVFLLIIGQYIPFSIVGLYVSLIVMGTAINASLPLYYETCIEATFPVAESVTMATITALYNILPITFLLIFLIPNIGTAWMNWCMYVALVLCVPLLVCFREQYNRLSLDRTV